ncbi:hypothetical protein AB0283_06265 [Micromonospora vinacea]|uniref:hypothetical protein n=1 Tax=Micromonospora vinacea TaxID=709878 RepID=UPI00344D424B
MTDLDQRIDQTLRERAEGGVDTDRLLSAAVTRGRARVRRRRTAAGTALGAVAVLGLGVAIGPVRLPGSGPDVVMPGLGLPANAPVSVVPPRADGVPGAAARPDLIGADPRVLHFGFAPDKVRYLSWSAQGGVETAQLDVNGHTVTLELSASTEALPRRAQGLPAELVPDLVTNGVFDGSVSRAKGPYGVTVWLRHWQPAPGVYARASVVADDERALFDVAATLRLDQAHGCTGPLRLTDLPAGAQLRSCWMVVGTFPAAYAVMLQVRDDERGPALTVELQYAGATVTDKPAANRTIGGRPAHFDPSGERLELLDIPRAQLFAALNHKQSFNEAEAATVLLGVRVAEHLDRPATW